MSRPTGFAFLGHDDVFSSMKSLFVTVVGEKHSKYSPFHRCPSSPVYFILSSSMTTFRIRMSLLQTCWYRRDRQA